jgi:hypothetical protein
MACCLLDNPPVPPMSRRTELLLAALTAAFVACGWAPPPTTPAPPHGSDIRVFDSPKDAAITEGETTLDVDPDTAYATVIDYQRWPSIFPDVHQVIITAQTGPDARVTFVGDAGHRDNLHFHNRPTARTVWFEDTGGRAEVWAEIAFSPGPLPGTTRVHSRLYADVHGLLSLVVTDSNLRDRRESRVTADLVHLHAFFARGDVARVSR